MSVPATLGARFRMPPERVLKGLRRILFLASAWPVLALAVGAWQGALGADPVDTMTRKTGIWALNFLMITLALAPLRQVTGWTWLLRYRRLFGLYSFFYACLHLTTYLVFEHFFDLADIVGDIMKRPFITAGFLTFGLLAPLAVTSTKAMVRRLGRHWKPLHRLAYLAAIGGVLHYLWLVKRDITDPGIYIIALCVLFSARLTKRRASAGSRKPAALQVGAAGNPGQGPQQGPVAHAQSGDCRARADAAHTPAQAEYGGAQQRPGVQGGGMSVEPGCEHRMSHPPHAQLVGQQGDDDRSAQHQQQAEIPEQQEIQDDLGSDHRCD